ncbi:MAG: hypothetical protein CK527_04310 [Nitrosarchaeum sp.]|nr:MAG: hypothetical protein CK527_04310 [Nitrosarchaeum sp.]
MQKAIAQSESELNDAVLNSKERMDRVKQSLDNNSLDKGVDADAQRLANTNDYFDAINAKIQLYKEELDALHISEKLNLILAQDIVNSAQNDNLNAVAIKFANKDDEINKMKEYTHQRIADDLKEADTAHLAKLEKIKREAIERQQRTDNYIENIRDQLKQLLIK